MAMQSQKRSLNYELVLKYLRAMLMAGKMRPGDRLPTVAELAAQLEVGLSSVREAYRLLESEGILEVTQGRGTFVSGRYIPGNGAMNELHFDKRQSLADLIETWRILKPEVAALAAERATPSEVEAIVATAEQMKSITGPGLEFKNLDFHFDELLFKACHNNTLAQLLYSLLDPILEVTEHLSTQAPGHIKNCIKAHNLIALAIQEGNRDAARAFMFQHVCDVEQDLKRTNVSPRQ
jgi:GntR family transcriptional repressor for pyruvate dehydrogenase complex